MTDSELSASMPTAPVSTSLAILAALSAAFPKEQQSSSRTWIVVGDCKLLSIGPGLSRSSKRDLVIIGGQSLTSCASMASLCKPVYTVFSESSMHLLRREVAKVYLAVVALC